MELPPERNEFVFSFFLEHMTWGFLSYGPNRAGPVEKQINFLIRPLIYMIYINNKIDSYHCDSKSTISFTNSKMVKLQKIFF